MIKNFKDIRDFVDVGKIQISTEQVGSPIFLKYLNE